ncbi:acVLRF1 family peptidyl-tRNA hydrolase [Nocardioides daphniae]|uniref:Actinobacteria/chloroflexi VLRF1 release factor domain-containing protein n=1 Tax=Nocardioides daphniae TaxID=402297 RepID=A0ABQ1QHC7_9ACTN|nr:acVLRF1 family peptidyl-tRNA hydrolase [Nocardioides daphniae]GGD25971.1 hypothetical protein GCM10007231_26730 [Nocardioides daphniae]
MPAGRFVRWVENFASRHGAAAVSTVDGALRGEAEDTSYFEARLPFWVPYAGGPEPDELVAALEPPDDWGVLIARRGGFAVARMAGERMVSSKVGQRHVQGRTKAGGQSQQRFARRRDNQAREAWAAAAGHASTHLRGLRGPLVLAGDREGLAAVVEGAGLGELPTHHLPDTVGEPRREALLKAVQDALSVRVTVHNAD